MTIMADIVSTTVPQPLRLLSGRYPCAIVSDHLTVTFTVTRPGQPKTIALNGALCSLTVPQLDATLTTLAVLGHSIVHIEAHGLTLLTAGGCNLLEFHGTRCRLADGALTIGTSSPIAVRVLRVCGLDYLIAEAGPCHDPASSRIPGDGAAVAHAMEQPWPGEPYGLTRAEAETLALIAQGLPNNAVAATLCISLNTLKTRIRHLYRKIGAKSRVHAVLWAIDHGFV